MLNQPSARAGARIGPAGGSAAPWTAGAMVTMPGSCAPARFMSLRFDGPHGFMTTLMQPSSLSRKVLYMAGPSSRPTVWVMTNDGSIWPSAMRCSRSSVQRLTCVCPVLIVSALVHHRAERDLVDQAAVDAGDRQRAGRPAHIDHLAQHMRPVALDHHRLLDAVDHRVDRAQRMRFHADRVDALVRALAGGQLLQPVEHALFVEVDRDRAAGARHLEPFGHVVDRDHLLGAEHHGAADRELADRARAPDRDRVGRLDVALPPPPASRSGRCRRGRAPARRSGRRGS